MFGRLQYICKQHSRFTAVGLKPRRGDTHAVQLTPHKPTGAVWCWRCARTMDISERCDRQRRMQSSWTVAYLRYAGPVASVGHHTTRYRAGVVLIALHACCPSGTVQGVRFNILGSPVTANCSPPHHKLPVGVARSGVDVRDVGAGGEVADVEDAAHVVHGEDSEELPLHVGNGDGLHGELLLAHDGDFVRGRMEIPLTLFAEWCALANEGKGETGAADSMCRCQTPFLAALVSPFYPHGAPTIPPTTGGGTSTENPRYCE